MPRRIRRVFFFLFLLFSPPNSSFSLLGSVALREVGKQHPQFNMPFFFLFCHVPVFPPSPIFPPSRPRQEGGGSSGMVKGETKRKRSPSLLHFQKAYSDLPFLLP